MEVVAIQISSRLYSEIFQRFGEETTQRVQAKLTELLDPTETNALPSAVNPVGPYTRPKQGTKTGQVWDIADRIHQETGDARREDVIRACMDANININTASTQYSYWRRANPAR